MKKIFVLFFAILLSMLVVNTCTFEYEGDEPERPSPAGLGKISDWNIEQGVNNNFPEAQMTIEEATTQLANNTEGTVMRVGWASNTDLRMCELWALLPEGFDYGEYDGVIYEVMINVSHNMMIALRNPPNTFDPSTSGTAWRLGQPAIYYNSLWWIVTVPFEDAEEPLWGEPATVYPLKDWLTEDKDNPSGKMLNINPQLNTGFSPAFQPPAIGLPNGNSLNTIYFNDFSRIGFYRGEEPSTDFDKLGEYDICWVWDFNKALEE